MSSSKEKHSQTHHHHHHKNKSRSNSYEKEKNEKKKMKQRIPEVINKEKKEEVNKEKRELKPFEKETWKNDKVDLEKLSDEKFDKEIANELKKNVKELKQTEEQLKKLREEDTKKFVPTKKKSPPKFEKLTTADPKMIEVIVNDRLGKKQKIKCCPSDTIGDLKKLIAVQTGTRAEKIKLQKQYCVYKDHITLEDYEIQDGMGMEMYYN